MRVTTRRQSHNHFTGLRIRVRAIDQHHVLQNRYGGLVNLWTFVVQLDFPILELEVHDGKRLVYLDSASSSQKPRAVLDAMDHYYETTHANVHRGVYAIAEEATAAYEGARARVARFIGAPSPREVVFTKNVTEAINLVAYAWGRANLRDGRRRAAHRDGAPRQPRPVADAAGGAGHRAALHPDGRRLHARPRPTSTGSSTA